MESTVIKEGEQFVVQPKDISTKKQFTATFGTYEAEETARWIVMFCRDKGGWIPMNLEEIDAYYRKYRHRDSFTFRWLTERNFVVKGEDGRYRVTREFVKACFNASHS